MLHWWFTLWVKHSEGTVVKAIFALCPARSALRIIVLGHYWTIPSTCCALWKNRVHCSYRMIFSGHRRHKLSWHQPPGVHAAQIWCVHRGRSVAGAAASVPGSPLLRRQVRAGGRSAAAAAGGAEQRGQVSTSLCSVACRVCLLCLFTVSVCFVLRCVVCVLFVWCVCERLCMQCSYLLLTQNSKHQTFMLQVEGGACACVCSVVAVKSKFKEWDVLCYSGGGGWGGVMCMPVLVVCSVVTYC